MRRGHYYRSKVLKAHSTSPVSYLEIENSSDNRLDVALPAGIVRVYEKAVQGANLFTGEDRTAGVAVNETLRIATGKSFLLIVEKTQTDYQSLGRNASKSSYEIEVRNRGEKRATVELKEEFPGELNLLKSNIKPTGKEAFGALSHITLKPGETKKLLYTVEVNFRWLIRCVAKNHKLYPLNPGKIKTSCCNIS